VKLFRSAQRDYDRCEADEAIETDLALFAEHTFSHCDSMSRPWDPSVHAIDLHKASYVARAAEAIGRKLDRTRLRPGLPLRFTVKNPFDEPVRDVVRLPVGHYEFNELGLDKGFSVEGWPCEGLPCEGLTVALELAAGEERTLEIVPGGQPAPVMKPTDPLHIDLEGGWSALTRADHPHAPFQPVHDVTAVSDRSEIGSVRGAMLLNRKGVNARQTAGWHRGVHDANEGEIFVSATHEYELPSTGFFEVEFKVHRHARRVDATVRMHKLGTWEPENLYVALPFAGEELHLFKTGAIVHPRREQIPGTLTDFYSVQEGFVLTSPGFGVAVAMPDNHLLQVGSLAHGERLLAGDPRLDDDPALLYAWLMTNYWETNFAADLGGFYEFRYSVFWGEEFADAKFARSACRRAMQGLEVVR